MGKLVSGLAPIVGGFFGGPTGAAIGSAVGGLFGGSSDRGAGAYATQADQQRQAGLAAASAGAFRPVGVTTRFGSSNFSMGTDQYGNPIVTGAGYNVSPELQALQDRLSALFPQAVSTAEQAATAGQPLGQAAQRMFNLGAGYLDESPEIARQRIFDELQAARQPAQMREEDRLASGVFGRGRAGLNISSMGQPELFGLGQAREQQRSADIVAANQQAMDQAKFGQGLFTGGAGLYDLMYGLPGAGLKPLSATLGQIQGIEGLGQQPLEIGSQLGGRNVNTSGAQAMYNSGVLGAQSQLTGSLQGQASGQSLLDNFLSSLGGTSGAGQLGQRLSSGFGNLFGSGSSVPYTNYYGYGAGFDQ
jgi:hypothetical protein